LLWKSSLHEIECSIGEHNESWLNQSSDSSRDWDGCGTTVMTNGRPQRSCVVAAKLHTLPISKDNILIDVVVVNDAEDGIPNEQQREREYEQQKHEEREEKKRR
jgi:hypothetical protein